ncbi:MAG: hypothetical protein EZS28_012688, partial [Streblomastix strix]
YSNKLLRENEHSLRGKADKEPFLSFLDILLQLDPRIRASAKRALRHPFVIGCGFDRPKHLSQLDLVKNVKYYSEIEENTKIVDYQRIIK